MVAQLIGPRSPSTLASSGPSPPERPLSVRRCSQPSAVTFLLPRMSQARAQAAEKVEQVWLEGDDVEDLNAFFSRAATALLDGLRRECQNKLNDLRERMREQYGQAVRQAELRAKEHAAAFVESFRTPAGSAVEAARGLPAIAEKSGTGAGADDAVPDVLGTGCTVEALRLEQLLQEVRQAPRPAFDSQGLVPYSAVTCRALSDCVVACREIRKYCEQLSQKMTTDVVVQALNGQEYDVQVRPASEHVHSLIGRLREQHHLPKHISVFTQSGVKLRSHDELKDYDLQSPLILTIDEPKVPRR